MATSDEDIYAKPGSLRRGSNNSALGFYSRGVQETEAPQVDDYSSAPVTDDQVLLPSAGDQQDDNNTDYDTDGYSGGAGLDNPRFIDVDPSVKTLTRVASLAAPTPIGLAAGIANAGINVNNLNWANAQREALGLEKLGSWETLKAAAGFSDYADGKVGAVDIDGRQYSVNKGGAVVNERTGLTAAEALARQAASRAYGTVSSTGNDSDGSTAFGTRDDPRAGRSYNSDFSSISNGGNGSNGNSRSDNGGNSGRDPNATDTPSGVSAAEGYGQMADSMRGSGNTNLGGGGGNDSGGGSSRVICTELYRQGLISREDWLRDLRYTSEHLSRQHVNGYHAWAIPTVRLMRKSRKWTAVWRVIGQARANQIAYIMGDRAKPDCFGVAAKIILEGFCWAIGHFVGERDAEAELSDRKGAN